MKAVGGAVGGLFKAIGLVPKRPKVPTQMTTPTPTRSDAAAIARSEALRSRRGGAADFLTGSGGAEAAPATAKELLGQ